MKSSPLEQSVQSRLVRHAKQLGVEANLVLIRYANERLLYRLSVSRHADRFVLKGAMLLLVWLGETIRPTRDVDLLGFGDLSDAGVAAAFHDVATVEVAPDGIVFDPSSIAVTPIREEDAYGGKRVTLAGRLGPARLKVQIDVGSGDAVYPEPEWIDYPALLDLPRPRLRAYRPETAVAEKVHAMITLGSKNSRMRDFFDVHALASHEPFDGRTLVRAIRTTFERRRTSIPMETPLALTAAFAAVEGKREQWAAFLRKNGRSSRQNDLESVVAGIAAFLSPVLEGLRDGGFDAVWHSGGPWR